MPVIVVLHIEHARESRARPRHFFPRAIIGHRLEKILNAAPHHLVADGGIVSATPRTYGGDYFVGINWLDPELRQSWQREVSIGYEEAIREGEAQVAAVLDQYRLPV